MLTMLILFTIMLSWYSPFVGKMTILKMFFFKICFPSQENKTYKSNNNWKLCTYYGRSGHSIDTCYKKHKYPPGYIFYDGKTIILIFLLFLMKFFLSDVKRDRKVEMSCMFLNLLLILSPPKIYFLISTAIWFFPPPTVWYRTIKPKIKLV